VNKEEILLVLEHIGADNIQVGSRNIQCSCFLAPWRKGHKRGTDSRPSMGIRINDAGESKVHCFACEYGGSLKEAVRELNERSGSDFSEVISLVDDYDNIDPLLVVKTIPAYDQYEKKKPEVVFGEEAIDDFRGVTHKYILNRGFSLDTLKEWESGYDPAYKRVVFPLRNVRGKLVGAIGRTVNNHKVRYFNYFHFDKSKYVFGEHKVRPNTSLIVVEGLLDTVKVWQELKKENLLDEFSVVGLLGSEPSFKQCRKIVSLANEVVLFLDNDVAGKLGKNKMAKLLCKEVLLKSVAYIDGIGNDPDEAVDSGYPLRDLLLNSKLTVAKKGDSDWR
jgi:hypothetical protein